jgi:chorismate mutase
VNLCILDCGLPDHPQRPNQPWAQCPNSLLAQLLASVQEYGQQRDLFTFLTTSTGVQGLHISGVERQAVACGLLKSFFQSTLLRWRNGPPDYWKLLTEAGVTSMSTTHDRVASYAEIRLDLSNLPELIAREVLAQWKKSVIPVEVISLDDIDHLVTKALSPDMEVTLEQIVLACARRVAVSGDVSAIKAPRLDMEDRKAHLVESLAAKLEQPVPPPKHRSIFASIIDFFKGKQETSSVQEIHESPRSLDSQIDGHDRVLRWLEALEHLGSAIIRPESDFQDRTGDHHFESSEDYTTLLIRYRRIPFNTCPPAVQTAISEMVKEVPKLIVKLLIRQCDPSSIATELSRRLQKIWIAEHDPPRDAEQKWKALGIIQWILADPSLARSVGSFAYQRLSPLWRKLPGRQGNWQGFITVFDFGAGPVSRDERDTRDGFERIRQALGQQHAQLEPLNHLEREWCLESLLEQDAVHFESWPFYYNLGLLWTEYPAMGAGFSKDWDTTDFEKRAAEWRKANPREAEWIGDVSGIPAGSFD